ncbi:MAG: hypothetical protein ACE5HS_17665 [bacterium]
MPNSHHPIRGFFLKIVFCCLGTGLLFGVKVLAQEDENPESPEKPRIVRLANRLLDGFTIGKDTRFFPYVTLDDWFDPYLGTKLEHGTFWNQSDRMFHHLKMENFSEISWKFRYQANSISTENTKFSLLIKTKSTDDEYFYGLADTSRKENREEIEYASYFIGGELQHAISKSTVLRWSAGVWNFQTELVAGGEFENAHDAQYVTSRLTFIDRHAVDYWKAVWDHHWSSYVEFGLPANTKVGSYLRFNFKSYLNLALFKDNQIGIGSRIEYLISDDKAVVPYFALPEAGSRSGLRGFSKERFRDFALTALNLEYIYLFSNSLAGFLLTDMALTGSDPTKLFDHDLHQSFGFGFRYLDTLHPLSVGFAAGNEGWKVFAILEVGSPW